MVFVERAARAFDPRPVILTLLSDVLMVDVFLRKSFVPRVSVRPSSLSSAAMGAAEGLSLYVIINKIQKWQKLKWSKHRE